MQHIKKKTVLRKRLLILSIIFFLILFILSLNSINFSSIENNDYDRDYKYQTEALSPSATYEVWYYDQQMLTNNNFDTGVAPWTNDTSNAKNDLDVGYNSQAATVEVLGGEFEFSSVSNPPTSSDWTIVEDPDTVYDCDTRNFAAPGGGMNVGHEWDESDFFNPDPDQVAGARYENNVSTVHDMSDYEITSVKLHAEIDADANANLEGAGEGQDYAKVYILITDYYKNIEYEIATLIINSDENDTPLNQVINNETLIFFLESVLGGNNYNFTITLGVLVVCEDNTLVDVDEWNYIRFTEVTLNFTYEKKINQLASVSWFQDGSQITNVDNPVVENATVQFDYWTDKSWLDYTGSQSSEIRFYINDELHSETVKLRDSAIISNTSTFDITSKIPIGININITIECYIWDEFILNDSITIYIDNVYLNVTYYKQPTAEVTTLDLFLEETNVTLDKYIEVNKGDLLNITVIYKNSTKDPIDSATVEIYGDGITGTEPLDPQGAGQYNYSLDTNNLEFGNNYLTVTAEKFAHETRVISNFRVKVLDKFANITKVLLNGAEEPDDTLEINAGEMLNITVEYTNASLGIIPDADLRNATSTNFNRELEWNAARQYYNITLNLTRDLGVGVSFITLSFEEENYTPRSRKLTIIVWEIGTEHLLYLNNTDITASPALSTVVNQELVINFTYRESAGAKKLISDADVSINGSGISEPMLQLGTNNYSVTINTNDLNQGINFLTIYATKTGYKPQSVILTITIEQVLTNLTLYVDGQDVTKTPSITREIGDVINITVYYREQLAPQDHISGASVNATIPGKNFVVNESLTFNHYNLTLDTNELNQGINFMTVYAVLANYQPQSIILTIEIIPKETFLNVSLDGTDRTLDIDKSISKKWNELLNVSITYQIDPSEVHIGGANVTIEGGGFSDELKEQGSKYNLTINTYTLGVGIHYLTIVALKPNYETQTVVIRVEVNNRDTDISYIFINHIDKTIDKTYEDVWNELFPVSVGYNDTATGAFITGATVTIEGLGLAQKTLPFDGENYTVTLNSYELGVGIHSLTIIAQQTNYTAASEVITVTITRRPTSIDEIFIDNVNKTIEKAHEDVWNELFPVSVAYNDTATGALITGATVTIEGSALLSTPMPLVGAGYTVTLSSYNLGVGVHSLTISAQKTNYTTASEVITVTITRRPTFIDEIFIDNVNKTTEKTHEDVWNELFPFRIAYNDTATGALITGATVKIVGSTLPSTPMPLVGAGYTVTLSSYDLGVGVHYLTISAQKTNYTTASEQITITVSSRPTLIDEIFINNINKTTEKAYEIAWDELFPVSVAYNDTATGTLITGATVTIAGSTLPSTPMPLVGAGYTVTLSSYDLGVGISYLTISAQRTNYSTTTENIIITVTEKETNLTTTVNATIISGIYQTKIGNTLNITVWYRDNETGTYLVDGTVELLGLAQPKDLTRSGVQWTILMPAENLSLGVKILTINAKQDNYSLITADLTVYVAEKGTRYDLWLDGVNYTGNEDITLTVGLILNVSLTYKEELSPYNPIPGGDVSINGSGISKLMPYNVHNNYSVLIDTDDLNQGINFLTIYALADNYEAQSILLIISIEEILTNFTLYIDGIDKTKTPSIKRTINDVINITVYYREQLGAQNHISDASINATIPGKVFVINESLTFDHYNLTLDTNELNRGINFITIFGLKANYQPQSIILTVEIVAIETQLTLFINGTWYADDQSADPSYDLTIGDTLNFTMIYNTTAGAHINGAVLQFVSGVYGAQKTNLTEKAGLGHHTIIVNSTDLNWGVNYLSILAEKTNYEPQTITIKITIINVETLFNISLDGTDRTLDVDKSILKNWNDLLNVTITYREDPSGIHVGGANVTIEGGTFTDELKETGQQYNLTINTARLGVGIHYLTILALKPNYETQTVVIRVEVINRDTAAILYVDEVQRAHNDVLQFYTNKSVNVTMIYTDVALGSNVSGATIQITGGGLTGDLNLTEIVPYGHYTYMLNTSHLAGTTNFLTVFAQYDNYTSQAIDFSIIIIEIRSGLTLFLSNTSTLAPEDRTASPSIKVVVDDFFNITVHYFDNDTKQMLLPGSGAEVRLIGEGFDEILWAPFNQWTYLVDSDDPRLGAGVNFLKIVATCPGYLPQDIDITVEIIDRQTEIKIYLNGVDKTIDRTLKLAFGKLIKFEVNFSDAETGKIINGSTVTIQGEGFAPTNLTQGSLYSITINTESIDIGIRFLTIFAGKRSYESHSATFRIDVARIRTEIELLDYDDDEINIKPGEDITIRVKLKDLDFGEVITEAKVEYTWEHGDGEMDYDKDGIWEITLYNVPEGTFTFVITVYAEDKYEFKRKNIDINSIRPPEDVRLLIFLAITIPFLTAIGSLLAYRQIQIAKTPTFVKKARAIKRLIKKTKVMPVAYVYPYRNEAFLKKYRKTWDNLGISLSDVLQLDFKEKKIAKVKAKKTKMNSYKFRKQKGLKKLKEKGVGQ